LESVTVEDATVGLGNWFSQRARWLKGWMQTWLVHMRDPARLRAEVGWHGFWAIQALLLGMIVSSLFHPFFLVLAIYQVCSSQAFLPEANWVEASVMASCAVVFVMGYLVTVEAGRRGLRRLSIERWHVSLITMPIYWLLISMAAWRAVWELVWKPFVWNKTEHAISSMKDRAKRGSVER
jgi:cellulose synthase/poly-beta-1,6-N-acetylglucosamine synthase-like glycosyltransferase